MMWSAGAGRSPGTAVTVTEGRRRGGHEQGLAGCVDLHRGGRDRGGLRRRAPVLRTRHAEVLAAAGRAHAPVPDLRLDPYPAGRAAGGLVAELVGHAGRGGAARPYRCRAGRGRVPDQPAPPDPPGRADIQRRDVRPGRLRRRLGVRRARRPCEASTSARLPSDHRAVRCGRRCARGGQPGSDLGSPADDPVRHPGAGPDPAGVQPAAARGFRPGVRGVRPGDRRVVDGDVAVRRRARAGPAVRGRWAMGQFAEQQRAYAATMAALCQAVETKDFYTRGHSERVSRGSGLIARQIGMRADRTEAIMFAGMLHDVGKLGVPTKVLQKTGPLTEEEFAAIQLHPMRGLEIVREIGFLNEALAGIMHHHEKVDGTGYPMGFAGNEIPEFARVIAVADAFDSMTSTRSYREARRISEAIE